MNRNTDLLNLSIFFLIFYNSEFISLISQVNIVLAFVAIDFEISGDFASGDFHEWTDDEGEEDDIMNDKDDIEDDDEDEGDDDDDGDDHDGYI